MFPFRGESNETLYTALEEDHMYRFRVVDVDVI